MCPCCEGAGLRKLTLDRRTPEQANFQRSRKVERSYVAQLRRLAAHIDQLVRGVFNPGQIETAGPLERLLRRYAETAKPWAEAVAGRMVAEVAARDRSTWMEVSRKMGRALRKEIETAPTGALMRQRLDDQVTLITSIPKEAADRVHRLAREGILQGTRPAEIAKEIMRTGEVSESKATLIARTEVSRTATELTRARAEHIGSTHFIWRTAGDSDVRPSHAKLNGKVFRWDDPPECDPGYRALPGGIFNCRCFPEVVVPD